MAHRGSPRESIKALLEEQEGKDHTLFHTVKERLFIYFFGPSFEACRIFLNQGLNPGHCSESPES